MVYISNLTNLVDDVTNFILVGKQFRVLVAAQQVVIIWTS